MLISVGVAIIAMVLVHLYMVPRQRRKILAEKPYNYDIKPTTF